MMIFFEDTNAARSIQARIASYSVSLLDAEKSKRMACSIFSPIRALSCKPTLVPRLSSSSVYIKDPLASVIRVRVLLGNLC